MQLRTDCVICLYAVADKIYTTISALPTLPDPFPSIFVPGEGRERSDSGVDCLRHVSLSPPASRHAISVLFVAFFVVDSRTRIGSEPPHIRTPSLFLVFQPVHGLMGWCAYCRVVPMLRFGT